MADSLWYPSVDDVVAIHDDVVAEYPDTPAGVRNRGDIEFALHRRGTLRLITGNYPREGVQPPSTPRCQSPLRRYEQTNCAQREVVFYFLNGSRFEYDSELRTMLKGFGTDEAAVDEGTPPTISDPTPKHSI